MISLFLILKFNEKSHRVIEVTVCRTVLCEEHGWGVSLCPQEGSILR
uniref:Uncharacterized protein n=1 Tax=Anguilla anguilla TaxID=7936 RepID=A0A0E9TIU9_ANGAN